MVHCHLFHGLSRRPQFRWSKGVNPRMAQTTLLLVHCDVVPAASHCVASVSRAAPRHARHLSLPHRQACRRGCEGLPSPSAAATKSLRREGSRLPALLVSSALLANAGSSGPAPRPVPLSAAPAGRRPLRARRQCACRYAICPRECGPLAAALALPSRPLRRRGLVHRLHHPVTLWSTHPPRGMRAPLHQESLWRCERRAPFLP